MKLQLIEQVEEHKEWIKGLSWCSSILSNADLFAVSSEDGTVSIYRVDLTQKKKIQKVFSTSFGAPAWKLGWSLAGDMVNVSLGKGSLEESNVVLREVDGNASKWEVLSLTK